MRPVENPGGYVVGNFRIHFVFYNILNPILFNQNNYSSSNDDKENDKHGAEEESQNAFTLTASTDKSKGCFEDSENSNHSDSNATALN